MKYIIFCTDTYTGGPFALLQLNNSINSLGETSEMIFADLVSGEKYDPYNQTVELKYKRLPDLKLDNLPYRLCNKYDKNDILIVPEIFPEIIINLAKAGFKNRIIWWLSWDNAPIGKLNFFEYALHLKNSNHIFQSKYAQKEAGRYGFEGSIVSDYTIYDNSDINKKFEKTIDVCYFPRKAVGAEKVLNQLKKKYTVKEIDGLKHKQVIEILMKSKFFIDFGHLPGKDRIPREAVLYNCIPILRDIGAAKYSEDFNISKSLKLDLNIFTNPKLLYEVLLKLESNRELILNELIDFKNVILNERNVFNSQVNERLVKAYKKLNIKDVNQYENKMTTLN
tara:strand:- start:5944 stop:6954 length:1011 start_codon:yes stop_codon:yes gene_type:complete